MSLLGHDSEQHILRLHAKGDTRFMDTLYGEYADYLAGVCSRYIRSEADMRDVLQEAFIRIFTRMSTFEYRGKGSLKAWITRVVVCEALRLLRNRTPVMFLDPEIDVPCTEEEEPDVECLSISQITESIRMLPPGYRVVFNLFAIEGKSHKEIAALLAITPGTSASQYHKARRMLAGILNEQSNKEGCR